MFRKKSEPEPARVELPAIVTKRAPHPRDQARRSAALRVAKSHPKEFAKAIADEERRRGIA